MVFRPSSPEQGNYLYPLPLDYPDLTEEGQRLARVNACKLQDTPEDVVCAWDFFRSTYLEPLPPGHWYKPPYYPSPPAHYKFIHDLAKYPRNVQSFRRAFGKSKLIKELILLWSYTRPYFKVLTIKSCDDFVTEDFQELMSQWEENALLQDDFGPIKPKTKGKKAWSIGRVVLRNGFVLVGRSIMSRLLGFRPNYVIFDDAELDPAMTLCGYSPQRTENTKYLFFHHVVPMLERGTSAALIGTLNNRKSFLYYMATADEKDDPRVSFFNRVILGAKSGEEYLWEEKWNAERLEEEKLELGSAAFAAMVLNDPGTEEDQVLKLDKTFGYYDAEGSENPLTDPSPMTVWRRDEEGVPIPIERPFGETVSKMYRVALCDPIRQPSITSDFACVLVLGIERSEFFNDTWYVLDIRLGRPKESGFISWMWELGEKWRVKLVGIEAIAVQKTIAEHARFDFAKRAEATGWMPRILPIHYTGEFGSSRSAANPPSKTARIMSLCWRFETHRIKLPKRLMHKPGFSDLLFQIENFTGNLALLSHDDALDTLAMAQFIGSGPTGFSLEDQEKNDPLSLLERGLSCFPGTNVPIAAALNAGELTPKALRTLETKRIKTRMKVRVPGMRRWSRF